MATRKLSIEQVNEMNFVEFQKIFANVVENCRFCAGAVWNFRPFRDVHHLNDNFCKFLDTLSTEGKLGVLRGFPVLAVRACDVKHLTPESVREQRGAGLLDQLVTEDERLTMQSLNEAYQNKFDIPFVICVRRNRKEEIVAGLRAAMTHSSKDEEVQRALAEAKKICLLRLLDLVESRHHL